MDLENQKRVKEAAEKFGNENVVVLLGASEAEAAGLAAETVTAGDPTFAGPLAGVALNLAVYHIVEEEIKSQIDEAIYEDQVGMMEMVLDIDEISSEMKDVRGDRDGIPGLAIEECVKPIEGVEVVFSSTECFV